MVLRAVARPPHEAPVRLDQPPQVRLDEIVHKPYEDGVFLDGPRLTSAGARIPCRAHDPTQRKREIYRLLAFLAGRFGRSVLGVDHVGLGLGGGGRGRYISGMGRLATGSVWRVVDGWLHVRLGVW